MSADSATKDPSVPFWREERSFRFINSRLKRNYLPTDPNQQHKENRTKSSFFFQSLKEKKKEMLLVSSPHFWWVNQISQKESWRHTFKNPGGWKSWSREVLTLHQWTFSFSGWPPRPEANILTAHTVHAAMTKGPTQRSNHCFPFKWSRYLQETARLALCLQPPSKTDASLEILPLQKGRRETQRPTRAEPTRGAVIDLEITRVPWVTSQRSSFQNCAFSILGSIWTLFLTTLEPWSADNYLGEDFVLFVTSLRDELLQSIVFVTYFKQWNM